MTQPLRFSDDGTLIEPDPLRPPETDEEPWTLVFPELKRERLSYVPTERFNEMRAARDRSRRIAAVCFLALVGIVAAVWIGGRA